MNNVLSKSSFWRDVWRLLIPYWRSSEKWLALALLGGIIISTVAQVRLFVIINRWQQSFYNALQAFSLHWIAMALLQFVLLLILAIIIFTYRSYLGGLLVNRWRRWLTDVYVTDWLGDHTAYGMQILNKNMDNPDQRISEDLAEFPTLTLSLFSGLLNALLTLFAFSIILWQLSGTLTVKFWGHTWSIPGYACWATLLYAVCGTAITHWIGRRLAPLNYAQEKFNANFRFGLVRVREFAEQITLYKGQTRETWHLRQLFQPVFENFLAIIRLQKYLGFFINGYTLLTQIVGIFIALPKYLQQRSGVGYVMQVSSAFEQVVGALSFIVNAYPTIANWRAVIRRLTEFHHLMETARQEMAQKPIVVRTASAAPAQLRVRDLQLSLPDQRLLIPALSFTLQAQDHLLITGKSGSGKSTLLRALAGVWPYGKGEIDLPASAKMLFLPQKPYFPLGTLRQALLYPESDSKINDDTLAALLAECGLPHLVTALDKTRYWSNELSLGEQQLIAFARIFLTRPDWVLLDEATSALDEASEARMYRFLVHKIPQITLVSVGHRASLRQFHTREICLTALPAEEK